MSLDDVAFPALVFSQEQLVVAPSADFLTVATGKAVRDGWYDNMLIADSAGVFYRVDGVEVKKESYFKRPKTPFGRGVRLVNFRIAAIERPSLDEVVRMTAQAIGRDETLWSAGHDVDALLRSLRACHSVEEIVLLFSG